MKKIIILVLWMFLLFSCGVNNVEEKIELSKETIVSEKNILVKII